MHIVIEGSLIRGFDAYGPFDTVEAAYDWASGVPDFGDEWTVMPLNAPTHDGEHTTVGEE